MHNPHFKRPDTTAPGFLERSPSPPRLFVEPLSPVPPSWRHGSVTYPVSKPRATIFTNREHFSAPQPISTIHSKSHKHGHRRASSSIDALADAALATSPDYMYSDRKSSEGMDFRSWPVKRPQIESSRDSTGEPPHKRARSEYVATLPLPAPTSRPVTSYEHTHVWNSRPESDPTPYDARVEEAALLLNFRTGGWTPTPIYSSMAPPLQTHFRRPSADSLPQNNSAKQISNLHLESNIFATLQREEDVASESIARTFLESGRDGRRITKTDWREDDSKCLKSLPAKPTLSDGLATRQVELSPAVSDLSSQAATSTSDDTQSSKSRRGWPKGKPRGLLTRKVAPPKPDAKKADKKGSHVAKTKRPVKRKPVNTSFADGTIGNVRRNSFGGSASQRSDFSSQRQTSVPREVPLMIYPSTKKSSKPRRKTHTVETICTACKVSREAQSSTDELDEWISCNGCKLWFHIDCAGFKKAHEVRDVDKYFCRDCEASHGKTTYVRKSTRAHAAVDYAELQKGVLKMSEESVEHHYVQPIKDGTFQFDPETFPRVKPELITRDFFEKSGLFVEPICIPAEWNPRPWLETSLAREIDESIPSERGGDSSSDDPLDKHFPTEFEYDLVGDEGQDRLGMVMPQNLTVRQVCNLVGPEYELDVIDVKSQHSGARWNLGRWADYYEEEGEDKAIRNVISLEVSQSRLGRVLKRPQVVRDIDLQDDVWPQEEKDKGRWPKVQFYCLMSVADSYTDFHIDFGGSSVYYHILRGKKTFFFIPPKPKHLKAYEEWNESPQQNYTFLPNITKECYRVDLDEGDTMLIPSGWIHAVWTPATSLVIGGNFLTRMSFKNQFRVVEIEKNNGTPMKFRYPFFQKIMWFTVLKYLREDPLPAEVSQLFYSGQQFIRKTPIWEDYEGDLVAEDDEQPGALNARYYPQSEVDGLPELVNYIFRTVMIIMGRVEGATANQMHRVSLSIPKGHGEPLEIAKTFALWVAWKRGNEDPPAWAHPDAVLPNSKQEGVPKKLSARALKEMERKEAIAAWRVAPDRQSARVMNRNAAAATVVNNERSDVLASSAQNAANNAASDATGTTNTTVFDKQTLNNTGPNVPDVFIRESTSSHPPPSVMTFVEIHKQEAAEPFSESPVVTEPPQIEHHQLASVVPPTSMQFASNDLSNAIAFPIMAGQHISTPKTSVLGPKRVACDVCRRRRIRCKHKDLVQQVENSTRLDLPVDSIFGTPPMSSSEVMDHGSISPGSIDKVSYTDGQHTQSNTSTNGINGSLQFQERQPLPGTNAYINANIPMAMNGIAIFGETPKRGRTKACLECRKSKRRCVHDGNGNVDPIKAQEAPVPRGTVCIRKQDLADNASGAAIDQSEATAGMTEASAQLLGEKPKKPLELNGSRTPYSHSKYHANGLEPAQSIPNSALSVDSDLFNMYTHDDDHDEYAQTNTSCPKVGPQYELHSLEQIANEVLDLNVGSYEANPVQHEERAAGSSPVNLPRTDAGVTSKATDSGITLDTKQNRKDSGKDAVLLSLNNTCDVPSSVIDSPTDQNCELLYQRAAPVGTSTQDSGHNDENKSEVKRKRVSIPNSCKKPRE